MHSLDSIISKWENQYFNFFYPGIGPNQSQNLMGHFWAKLEQDPCSYFCQEDPSSSTILNKKQGT